MCCALNIDSDATYATPPFYSTPSARLNFDWIQLVHSDVYGLLHLFRFASFSVRRS